MTAVNSFFYAIVLFISSTLSAHAEPTLLVDGPADLSSAFLIALGLVGLVLTRKSMKERV
jgi:hypothetical protein